MPWLYIVFIIDTGEIVRDERTDDDWSRLGYFADLFVFLHDLLYPGLLAVSVRCRSDERAVQTTGNLVCLFLFFIGEVIQTS